MEIKKSPWPVAIASFLAVVFAVNFVFLYFAVTTDDGLTDERYYEKGLFYDDNHRDELELGWKLEVSFSRPPETVSENDLYVNIVNPDGSPVEGVVVNAILKRPATDRFDRPFAFVRSGPSYKGSVLFPMPGWWDIAVTAEKEGKMVEKTFRVKV